MRLEDYPVEKLNQDLKRIIGKHLDLENYKLFYFGSRVTGKGDSRSDIDVGIKGKQKIDSKTIIKIKEEVEWLPTLYSIDIVDFADTNDEFRSIAEKNIEVIN